MIFRGPVRPFILLAILVISVIVLLTPWGMEAGQRTKKVLLDATIHKTGVGLEEDTISDWEYRRALSYEGTGGRIHDFLEKAKSGRPYTVSVIGGSVSKGRGLIPPSTDQYVQPESNKSPTPIDGEDATILDPLRYLRPAMGASTLYSSENMHVRIFDWLNSTFPHVDNRFVNGAQGGVGSGYFGWCFNEHIPESSDLILLELGINDLVGIDVMRSYEILVRGLLELPHKPAIIGIETFSTLFETIAQASALHHDVNAFYDIPSISVREAILPKVLDQPEEEMPKWFRTGEDVTFDDESKVRLWGGKAVDVMHISALGHHLVSRLVIHYLNEQMRRTSTLSWRPSSWNRPSYNPHTDVPSITLTASHDLHHHISPRHNPICRSMNSPILHPASIDHEDEHEHEPKTGSMSMQGLALVSTSHGWRTWSWGEKRYLVADKPGALAMFDFTVTNSEVQSEEQEEESQEQEEEETLDLVGSGMEQRGTTDIDRAEQQRPETGSASVLISYQRSAMFGLGSVLCWVDSERDAGVVIDGYWREKERNMGMVSVVAEHLTVGRHRLSCELLDRTADPGGGHEFRFIAVMHG